MGQFSALAVLFPGSEPDLNSMITRMRWRLVEVFDGTLGEMAKAAAGRCPESFRLVARCEATENRDRSSGG